MGAPNVFSGCSVPTLLSCIYTIFQNNCGRCESYITTTCHETVVGVSNDVLPVNIFAPTNPHSASMECHRDQKAAAKMR